MIYAGIDPGLNGGVALILEDQLHLYKTPIIGNEYDIVQMKNILVKYKNGYGELFFTLEKQMALPGQGLTSTFKTGMGFGIWLGLLSGLGISHQVVSAQRWQKLLFDSVPRKLETKEASVLVAKRLFPVSDFRRSERAKKDDDGLTDAACIAEFGRRTYH